MYETLEEKAGQSGLPCYDYMHEPWCTQPDTPVFSKVIFHHLEKGSLPQIGSRLQGLSPTTNKDRNQVPTDFTGRVQKLLQAWRQSPGLGFLKNCQRCWELSSLPRPMKEQRKLLRRLWNCGSKDSSQGTSQQQFRWKAASKLCRDNTLHPFTLAL
ncbi:hypothetical protein Y1Q_0004299 [Alligator mississippiensis]|uniref:Uncharacterized protein n=1 Tax=Alligator mississippiensis TaxID=8496 RepID=A0A151MIN7_ALLMI|nr:hypothetical protein Y1Q_0004299 [Alligator mississippiensis]